MADIVNSSRMWDVRHIVVERIDSLDAAAATLEQLLIDIARRREELGRRLEEAQSVWARVRRNPAGVEAAGIDEAFTALSSARAELAALQERDGALRQRLADGEAEQVALRSVIRTVDDIARSGPAANGSENGLHQTLRDLFQSVEEQRRRVARDLREGPLPEVTELAVRAEQLERMLGQRRAQVVEELVDLEVDLRGLLDRTRELVQELDPEIPDELGLVPSLRRLVREFQASTGMPTELRVEGIEQGLTPAQQKALHLIVQEALDNVRRHSGASRAAVALSFLPPTIRLSVADDGRGFDVITTEDEAGRVRALGLRTMRERATATGGSLQVRSVAGRGTEVLVTFEGSE